MSTICRQSVIFAATTPSCALRRSRIVGEMKSSTTIFSAPLERVTFTFADAGVWANSPPYFGSLRSSSGSPRVTTTPGRWSRIGTVSPHFHKGYGKVYLSRSLSDNRRRSAVSWRWRNATAPALRPEPSRGAAGTGRAVA